MIERHRCRSPRRRRDRAAVTRGRVADPRQVPWPATIVGDPGLAVNPSALAARFREKREEILTEGSPAAARWAAFSGGAWDAAATARALDEAVLALSGAGDDVPPDEAPEASRRVLRRLPEATARWRAALSGRDLPPVPDDDARAWTGDEPTTTLVDAFNLLVRVLRTVEREGLDVPPATPGVTDAAQPVGEAYAWPAGVAWEVRNHRGPARPGRPPPPGPGRGHLLHRTRDAARALRATRSAIGGWFYRAARVHPPRARVGALREGRGGRGFAGCDAVNRDGARARTGHERRGLRAPVAGRSRWNPSASRACCSSPRAPNRLSRWNCQSRSTCAPWPAPYRRRGRRAARRAGSDLPVSRCRWRCVPARPNGRHRSAFRTTRRPTRQATMPAASDGQRCTSGPGCSPMPACPARTSPTRRRRGRCAWSPRHRKHRRPA